MHIHDVAKIKMVYSDIKYNVPWEKDLHQNRQGFTINAISLLYLAKKKYFIDPFWSNP